MLNDAEVDMEELEARLYGQIYHSSDRDNDHETTYESKDSFRGNTAARLSGRYFDGCQLYQSPYNSVVINEALQNITNLAISNLSCAPDNLSPLPEFIPTVNNVVILPPPLLQHDQKRGFVRVRERYRENRRKRRAHNRKVLKETKRMMFKEHRINSTKVISARDNAKDFNKACDGYDADVIYISESGSSDCEITEPHVSTVELISENEGDNKTATSEVKYKNKQGLPVNKDDGNDNNQVYVVNSEDDEVVFVKSKPNEMIVISCDETSMQGDGFVSNMLNSKTDSVLLSVDSPSKECLLVHTPESTNDFLDGNINHNIDVADNVCSSASIAFADMEESESNHSISDLDETIKFAKDKKHPNYHESFSELNLDTFMSFIASKNNESGSGLNLNSRRIAGCKSNSITKSSKSKRDVELHNSSDSSSESDYEEANKVELMKDKRQTLVKQPSRSSSTSESDYCVVDEENVPESSDGSKLNKNEVSGKKNERIVVLQSGGDCKIGMAKEGQFFSSTDDESLEVEIMEDIQKNMSVNNFELANISKPLLPKQSIKKPTGGPKKFSDYWTDDMRKFYFESWGHENFSLEKELAAMSDDPSKWKISNSDHVNVNLSPRRLRCHRCRESGHKAMNCTKLLGLVKCALCGASGHQESRCPNKLCTSCGRRSHYFTTYCSKCAVSRQMCRICSAHGHTQLWCNDLWRRYHLTTQSGPLKQPSNFNLKPAKERWCSGCGSRGHFEHDCSYYSRTHAPSNISVHSYVDVYNSAPNMWYQEEWESNTSTQNSSVSPTSCYPQYTTFQSVPHGFSLQQNITNVFYPTADQYSECLNDTLNKSPTTQETESSFPLLTRICWGKRVQSKIILNDEEARRLLSDEGARFLRELTKGQNVTVKIVTTNKTKKLCILRGQISLLAKIRKEIGDYCQRLPQPLQVVDDGFSTQLVRQKLMQLANKNNWVNRVATLYHKIMRTEKQFKNSRQALLKRSIAAHEQRVRNLYKDLNSLLIGKLNLSCGVEHLKVLEDGGSTEAELKCSYDYVFNNGKRLDIDYKQIINNLIRCKKSTTFLLKEGTKFCEANNMTEKLRKFRVAYERMIKANYYEPDVCAFKELYDAIKNGNKRIIKMQHNRA